SANGNGSARSANANSSRYGFSRPAASSTSTPTSRLIRSRKLRSRVVRPQPASSATAPRVSASSKSRFSTSTWSRSTVLDIQARVLEIEVALDLAHDVIADPALVAQRHDRVPFRVEQLPAQALIRLRLLFDAAVAAVVRLGEAVYSEAIQAAHALRRIRSHPILVDELVEPGDRGLSPADPRLRLLFLLRTHVLLESQHAGHERQRQSLYDERREHDAECEEDDQAALGEGGTGVRAQWDRQR